MASKFSHVLAGLSLLAIGTAMLLQEWLVGFFFYVPGLILLTRKWGSRHPSLGRSGSDGGSSGGSDNLFDGDGGGDGGGSGGGD